MSLQPTKLDEKVNELFVDISQRIGRRSFICRIGKTIAVLMGYKMMEPVIAMAVPQNDPNVGVPGCKGGHSSNPCDEYGKYCSLLGKICVYSDVDPKKPCIRGGCPKGTHRQGSWTANCKCLDGGGESVTFTDCCGDVETAYCIEGNGQVCPDGGVCNPSVTNWCNGNGTYRCTIAE